MLEKLKIKKSIKWERVDKNDIQVNETETIMEMKGVNFPFSWKCLFHGYSVV